MAIIGMWILIVGCHLITISTSHPSTNRYDRLNLIFQEIISGPLELQQSSVVQRSEWRAKPPSDIMTDLELPSSKVIIAHTGTPNCDTKENCSQRVRSIQNYHMDSNYWFDIAYNFLVGGDGSVYIGRGWDKQGAHTKGYNKKSICIAFIGTFIATKPSFKQLQAATLLIEEGVHLHKLDNDYKLYGQRQLVPTESPGQTLFGIIKEWPHFSEVI